MGLKEYTNIPRAIKKPEFNWVLCVVVFFMVAVLYYQKHELEVKILQLTYSNSVYISRVNDAQAELNKNKNNLKNVRACNAVLEEQLSNIKKIALTLQEQININKNLTVLLNDARAELIQYKNDIDNLKNQKSKVTEVKEQSEPKIDFLKNYDMIEADDFAEITSPFTSEARRKSLIKNGTINALSSELVELEYKVNEITSAQLAYNTHIKHNYHASTIHYDEKRLRKAVTELDVYIHQLQCKGHFKSIISR